MAVNWLDVKKCPIWKELGITECNDCDSKVKCWGKELVLPEPTDARGVLLTYAMLGTAFGQQHKERRLGDRVSIICKHGGKPYYSEYFARFVKPSEPTSEEINRLKLRKCPKCLRWYSLIGRIKRAPISPMQ